MCKKCVKSLRKSQSQLTIYFLFLLSKNYLIIQERKKFKDKEAEQLANDQEVLEYKNVQVFIRKKLELLLSSQSLKDLHLTPSIRLEKLKVKGQKYLYSIRVSKQYRIIFIWENNEAWEIEINKHDKKYGK